MVVASSERHPSKDEQQPTIDGAFSTEGVDLTVIRWMLDKSPTERLEAAQDLIDGAWALESGHET